MGDWELWRVWRIEKKCPKCDASMLLVVVGREEVEDGKPVFHTRMYCVCENDHVWEPRVFDVFFAALTGESLSEEEFYKPAKPVVPLNYKLILERLFNSLMRR